MDCLENCRFKREAYHYGKEYEKLLKKVESGKYEQAIEDERRAKNNAMDKCTRLKEEAEKKEQRIKKLQETVENYKDKLVWSEEERQKENKEATRKMTAMKKEIGKAKKEISDIQWRTEKEKKELTREYEKKLRLKDEEISKIEAAWSAKLAEKDEEIKHLKEHIQGTATQQSQGVGKNGGNGKKANSTNSSIPPSNDPNHSTITNNREPTGKTPGAQDGHKAQPRQAPKPDRVIKLPTPSIVQENPEDWYSIGTISKKVIRIYMGVEVIEYIAEEYRNHKTREKVHSSFPEGVGHLETNYDSSVDALITYLHSVCNVPYGKIQEFITENTKGRLEPISIGKMADMEKHFSELSKEEREEIARNLFCGRTMNIDGTSIRINGKQRQMLVMCNKENVLYKMSGCKGNESVKGTPAEHYPGTTISDSESTFTKLGDKNQRCVIHEGRYLKRAMEDTPYLDWSKEMLELLKKLQHQRNVEKDRGETSMKSKEREQISEEYDKILRKGSNEYMSHFPELYKKHLVLAEKRLANVAPRYGLDIASLPHPGRGKEMSDNSLCPGMTADLVSNLVKDINMLFRFMEAKDSYLLFLKDYSIDPHNNDALCELYVIRTNCGRKRCFQRFIA